MCAFRHIKYAVQNYINKGFWCRLYLSTAELHKDIFAWPSSSTQSEYPRRALTWLKIHWRYPWIVAFCRTLDGDTLRSFVVLREWIPGGVASLSVPQGIEGFIIVGNQWYAIDVRCHVELDPPAYVDPLALYFYTHADKMVDETSYQGSS